MYKLVNYICINIHKSILSISTFKYARVSIEILNTGSCIRTTKSSTIYNAIIKSSLRIGIFICFDKGSKL